MTRPAAQLVTTMSHKGASLPLHDLLHHTASVVRRVQQGRSLQDEATWDGVPSHARAGTQALVFLSLRHLGLAEALLARYANRRGDARVSSLALVALALLSAHHPSTHARPYDDHTVVDQAVKAVRRVGASSAGFINAVLRGFLRERDAAITAVCEQSDRARHNLPLWWVERVRRDWGEGGVAERVLAHAHEAATMTLRVNTQRSSLSAYLKRLEEAGLAAHALAGGVALQDPSALRLTRNVPVSALPGFAEGEVSVQDLAAQWAAPWLLHAPWPTRPTQRPLRVLDACAAPGGKTAHLLEWDPSLEVVAMDVDASRLERVRANLARLGLEQRARCVHADASDPASWPEDLARPGGFDAVLLDAPCSASGIVRRHPDIAWLRREADLSALTSLQAKLLDRLWPLVAPGGRLLYATCSIFKSEGVEQIDAFLQRAPHSKPEHLAGLGGHHLPLPDNRGSTSTHDGFFYALLQRQPAG